MGLSRHCSTPAAPAAHAARRGRFLGATVTGVASAGPAPTALRGALRSAPAATAGGGATRLPSVSRPSRGPSRSAAGAVAGGACTAPTPAGGCAAAVVSTPTAPGDACGGGTAACGTTAPGASAGVSAASSCAARGRDGETEWRSERRESRSETRQPRGGDRVWVVASRSGAAPCVGGRRGAPSVVADPPSLARKSVRRTTPTCWVAGTRTRSGTVGTAVSSAVTCAISSTICVWRRKRALREGVLVADGTSEGGCGTVWWRARDCVCRKHCVGPTSAEWSATWVGGTSGATTCADACAASEPRATWVGGHSSVAGGGYTPTASLLGNRLRTEVGVAALLTADSAPTPLCVSRCGDNGVWDADLGVTGRSLAGEAAGEVVDN